jgi:hypothetical protein
MVNFVVCSTAPHCLPPVPSRRLETGLVHVSDAPYWRFIETTFCNVLGLSLGQHFVFVFMGQICPLLWILLEGLKRQEGAGGYVDVRGLKWQANRETCVIMSFTICTLQQIQGFHCMAVPCGAVGCFRELVSAGSLSERDRGPRNTRRRS